MKKKGGLDRRLFIKSTALGVGTALMSQSCERPVQKLIPMIIQPENLVQGVSQYYASTITDGPDSYPVRVRSVEGRPVKIDGNPFCPLVKGTSNALVQASLLGLYNSSRLKSYQLSNSIVDSNVLDSEIIQEIKNAESTGKQTILVTGSIHSPSIKRVISELLTTYKSFKHFQLDPFSLDQYRNANRETLGIEVIPFLRFDQCQTIVSFQCDFLGTWLMPHVFAVQYSQAMKGNAGFEHYQFESALTITGQKATHRDAIHPDEELSLLWQLYNSIAKRLNSPFIGTEVPDFPNTHLVNRLIESRGNSLVVSGTNNFEIQCIVNSINYLLDNYNNTIDIQRPINVSQSVDTQINELLAIHPESVSMLIVQQVDLLSWFGTVNGMSNWFKQIEKRVFVGTIGNITQQFSTYIVPESHCLESWGDHEPVSGYLSFSQPLINPLFKTRSFLQTLLVWCGRQIQDDRVYVRETFFRNFLPLEPINEEKWLTLLQEGLYSYQPAIQGNHFKNTILKPQVAMFPIGNRSMKLILQKPVNQSFYSESCNPWLQELPHPVTKQSWGNVAMVSPEWMKSEGVENGQLIEISGVQIPILGVNGIHPGVIIVELGYGLYQYSIQAKTGTDVWQWVKTSEGQRLFQFDLPELKILDKTETLVLAQTKHNEIEGLKELNLLGEYNPDREDGLYPTFHSNRKRLGMIIDLDLCIGCGACSIACQAENNIPAVGPQEVSNGRLMHWIKIDRYRIDKRIVNMPVMCQQCGQAPCESVCPVSATSHSSDGINQMVYNRCIGSRFCANACPYEARVFNWYDYTGTDLIPLNNKNLPGLNMDLISMALNPDVTIRTRGTMEKCNLCFQRVGKMSDSDEPTIQTACAQTCPTQAIRFGYYEQLVATENKLYTLLPGMNTFPGVLYQSERI